MTSFICRMPALLLVNMKGDRFMNEYKPEDSGSFAAAMRERRKSLRESPVCVKIALPPALVDTASCAARARIQRGFNRLNPSDQEAKQEYMKEVFADCGSDCYIELPFHANWGGHHVHFGSGVYANFHLPLVDDGHIYIGDRVMIGPKGIIPKEKRLRSRRPVLRVICAISRRSIRKHAVPYHNT